jgi:exopolysaccharide biosynthesis polyprenyl glycosylphosphotransferase
MFIRRLRSIGLVAGEASLLVAAVVAGAFMRVGRLTMPALPALPDGSGLLGMFVLVSSWRLTFAWLASRVAPRERLLLVGTHPTAVELARELNDRRRELGIEIVGFVDANADRVGHLVLGRRVRAVDDIPAIIRDDGAERIVVSLSDARGTLPMDRLLDIRLQTPVAFDDLSSAYEAYTGKIAIETLRPSAFVFSSGFRQTARLLTAKRTLDVVLAAAVLIVTAPLVLLAAALVKLTSRDRVIDREARVGLNGALFTLYKIRTTRADADAAAAPGWSRSRDAGVTPIGRFLRATRVDALPQLWNVLRGDMSLVGPRPERPHVVAELGATLPFFTQRQALKPGITGWAQIHCSYADRVDAALEKLQYDLYYLKNLSLWLDVLILVETVKTVLRQRGAR